MKYDLIITNLAIVGGLLGLAGVSYSQPAQLETLRQQALQRLREEGATIDNTVQCVDIDYHEGSFSHDPWEVQIDAEYAALEKHFSSRGERIVYWGRVNQQRRVLTVKDSASGVTAPTASEGKETKDERTGNIYAYRTVNFREAYSGEREVYCVQSGLPSDLTLVEAGVALSEAYSRLDRVFESDKKQQEQEMDKQRRSLEQRLEERKDGTRRRLEQTMKEWEERRNQYREGSQERIETYRREHEQTRRQWYQEHGTLPASLTDTPQTDRGENPPPKAGESGAQRFERANRKMKKDFDDAGDRIKKDYDGTSEEIRRRFEQDKERIRKRFEEESKKIREQLKGNEEKNPPLKAGELK